MKKTYLILLSFFSAVMLHGQKTTFSQQNLSPLTINPALTGSMDGAYRMGVLGLRWGNYQVPLMITNINGDCKVFKKTMGGINYFGVGLILITFLPLTAVCQMSAWRCL